MWLALVRHAAVEADPAGHSALWPLSDGGRQAARALAREPLWQHTVRIFTSPELKTHETAQIIAGTNGMTVTAVEDLREVERPAGQWFADYRAAVAEYFAHPEQATHGWEPPAAAQARIRACIDGLVTWERAPVAVCGHGLTLSLYLASLTGAHPLALWPSINFPDVAVLDRRRRRIRPFGRWAGSSRDGSGTLAPTRSGADHPQKDDR